MAAESKHDFQAQAASGSSHPPPCADPRLHLLHTDYMHRACLQVVQIAARAHGSICRLLAEEATTAMHAALGSSRELLARVLCSRHCLSRGHPEPDLRQICRPAADSPNAVASLCCQAPTAIQQWLDSHPNRSYSRSRLVCSVSSASSPLLGSLLGTESRTKPPSAGWGSASAACVC